MEKVNINAIFIGKKITKKQQQKNSKIIKIYADSLRK